MKTITPELTLTETLYYDWEGFTWVVKGCRLFQIDDNYLLELPIGTEIYASKLRRLRTLKPISQSQGEAVLNKLKTTIAGF